MKRRPMTGHFLDFESIYLSSYAFPGMEYQETSVGFTFLTIPRLGERQFYISELFSVNAYEPMSLGCISVWNICPSNKIAKQVF